MKLNLLVIRTADLEALKTQYSLLGLQFDHHRHGNGPMHYSTEVDGLVLEIYPLSKDQTQADGGLRLGLEVDDLDSTLDRFKSSSWRIISEAKNTDWGRMALIQDLEGRKIELKDNTLLS